MAEEQTITARQRLAEISHHFLDNNNPGKDHCNKAKQKPKQHFFKLAITNPPYSSFPHYVLAEFLNELGITTDIIDERGLKPCHTMIRPSHYMVTSDEKEQIEKSKPDIHLILPGNITKQPEHHCHTLLVPVVASKDGIRHAFVCIKKQLRSLSADHIGINIINAADKQTAQRCYKTLAIAIQKFLGELPASYSHLEIDHPESQMAGIAELIQLDLEQWREGQVQASIQSLLNSEDGHEHSHY